MGYDLDGRSDLWSVGCVLYELLTGSSPFERASLMQSCAAVLEEGGRPIRGADQRRWMPGDDVPRVPLMRVDDEVDQGREGGIEHPLDELVEPRDDGVRVVVLEGEGA